MYWLYFNNYSSQWDIGVGQVAGALGSVTGFASSILNWGIFYDVNTSLI